MRKYARYFLFLAVLAQGTNFGIAKQAVSQTTPQTKRPNILFLFADDMRAESIGALGDTQIKTPNLDAVVQRGFVMTNAYCLGGNIGAVCTPSRNMLLSGNAYFRWRDHVSPNNPNQKGILSPGDGPNFPLTLRAAGYQTYHHGKRGNSALLIQEKFEINKYLKNDMAERNSGEPGQEIADEAIAFLKGQRDARPFAMYLAFGNPHDPRVAAKKYLDLYDREKLKLPRNFMPLHPFDNGDMTVRDEALSPWPRTPEEMRKTWHEYYATMSGLDFHIGRILQTLKDLKLEDNTIIVFSADQGISIGGHGLLGKQNLYEHGMKAPLFFAGPGIPRGRSNALVYLLDIHPTIADLVGASIKLGPPGIDGVSFKPVITGKAKTARSELMLAYRHVQRAYRDERWKLIRYPQVNVTQLFDLRGDPFELKNLADEPAQKKRIEQLTARLQQMQKQFGDSQSLTVPNPQPAAFTPPASAPKK
ncbi:MAG: sulfatase-like hydrolase/transferase [Blastocatellia bacterium]